MIAVDLEFGHGGAGLPPYRHRTDASGGDRAGWTDRLLARFGFAGGDELAVPRASSSSEALPPLVSVISSSINIMQVRIARSRLAGEPADVMISPRVGQLGLMDYHRAAEAIAEGEAAVMRMRPLLRYVLGHDPD